MHGKYAFARIETVTERRRLRRLFLRFSFADCRHIANGCRNEVEITAKTQFVPLCKLYEKTTFSAWLYKHFPAFVRLFVLRRLFALERCFPFVGNGLKRLRKVQTSTCFFLFSAKAVLLAFLYFCFGQIFTSLHLFLAVKIIKCK